MASGSDPSNARQKMTELRQNQKADVVLKQELGLYRRLHGPEYPQLAIGVAAFSRNNAHARIYVYTCVGVCCEISRGYVYLELRGTLRLGDSN